MIDYTASCPHHTLTPVVAAYVTDDPDVPGAYLYSAHMAVTCAVCGVKFRFNGNMPLAPETIAEAQSRRLGAWVTADQAELGVSISPIIASGAALESVAVMGRA